MFDTTVTAMKALLQADPQVTPADRARILAMIRNHGRAVDSPPPPATEKQILVRADVARRFHRSIRFVDHLAKLH